MLLFNKFNRTYINNSKRVILIYLFKACISSQILKNLIEINEFRCLQLYFPENQIEFVVVLLRSAIFKC